MPVPNGDAPDMEIDRFRSFSVAMEVLCERVRQDCVLGYTPEHDAAHIGGELALAAAALAAPPVMSTTRGHLHALCAHGDWLLKPKPRRTELVQAAALIFAEIERIDRAMEVDRG